ncbi:tetratricopeptide repeat protein [Polaribacter sp.]|uniref:tetratricopeptide repeat protein n=1 Tax=Polaribacter sp. TaxID=1920175 RepID=UPI003F6B2F2F
MKKQIITLSLGLMTVLAFGQKKQLRTAEKAIKKQQYAEALTTISSVDGMLADMDEKYKAKYYFLKGQALAGKKNFEEAAESFNTLFSYEKEIGRQRYTKDAQPMLNTMIQKVSERAINLYNKDQDFSEAAKNFALTYKLSPKDTAFLYNAALSASRAKELDASLKYFRTLKEVGYTGIETQYLATEKATGKVANLGSKQQRDLMVKSGTYTNPENKVTDSKQAEIVKNIGYILVQQGKTEEAIVALQEARKANPKDVNLILNEAQLYIKLEKMDKFGALMKEAVQLDPTNPILFFNLGVVNANENKHEEAIKYYNKAIELDPKYGDAYMNLAVSMLAGEKEIVDEMNKNLSNFKKYDELQEKQKALYKKALPFIIKADNLKRTEGTVRSLLNIYDTLRMEKEADALRPIYKKMRTGN